MPMVCGSTKNNHQPIKTKMTTTMHIQSRFSLTIAALAVALASGLPKNVSG